MARTKRGTPPSYHRHSCGQACVSVREPDARRHEILLGPWESPESKAEYARVLAEPAANEGRLPPQVTAASPSDRTITEILLAFLKHAGRHYRDADGAPTGEADNYLARMSVERPAWGEQVSPPGRWP